MGQVAWFFPTCILWHFDLPFASGMWNLNFFNSIWVVMKVFMDSDSNPHFATPFKSSHMAKISTFEVFLYKYTCWSWSRHFFPKVSTLLEHNPGPHVPPCWTMLGMSTLSVIPTAVFTATMFFLLASYRRDSLSSLLAWGMESYTSLRQSSSHNPSKAFSIS